MSTLKQVPHNTLGFIRAWQTKSLNNETLVGILRGKRQVQVSLCSGQQSCAILHSKLPGDAECHVVFGA